MKNQENLLHPRIRIGQLIQAASSRKTSPVKTGIPDLDDLLYGGFHPGNVYMIGSRPAVGKTSLMLTMCNHISRSNKVLFASAEMNKEMIGMRLNRLRANANSNGNVICFGKGTTSIQDIIGLAEDLLELNIKVKAVFVDYINLFIDDPKFAFYAVRLLKRLATDLNIPVIISFQLLPTADNRVDGIPSMDDFPFDDATMSISSAVMYLYDTGLVGDFITHPKKKLFVDGFDVSDTGTIDLLFWPERFLFMSEQNPFG